MLAVCGLPVFASLGVVSLRLVCMYVEELSAMFDIVFNYDFVYCVLGKFPNDTTLEFNVVSNFLSVCVICFCVLGGIRFGFWDFWIVSPLSGIGDFYRCSTMRIVT